MERCAKSDMTIGQQAALGWFRFSLLALLAAFAASASVATQGARGQSTAPALAQARRALAAGQPVQALRLVEPLLARTPADKDVVGFAIEAFIAIDDTSQAYALYDTFTQTTGAPAVDLLKPIAVKELRNVIAGAVHDPRLRTEAFERLARDGDTGAAGSLRQDGRSAPARVALLADAALSRLGDENATKRIESAIGAQSDLPKTAEAEALIGTGKTDLAPLLVPLLKHPDPYTRAAAVEGLGTLGHKAAVDEMRVLLKDPFVEVRTKTALALSRLGDSAGRDIVSAMLRSPVPDVRLNALEANPSIIAAERITIIRTLVTDRDPLNRVRAAEALARDYPEEARGVLVPLTQNPDSMARREASRVLGGLTPIDLDLSRQLMVDSEPWVRMYAAGSVLRAAR